MKLHAVFIEPSALAQARAAKSSDPVLAALHASTERAIAREPASFPSRTSASNLFFIQTSLLELALRARLEAPAQRTGAPRGEATACERALIELILALDPRGTCDEHLPTEVHAAFVVIGLAVALELAHESLDGAVRAQGHAAIERLARRLDAGAGTEAWGQRAINRAAWNHSIVAFAALGVAGLALPDHPDSQKWIALATEHSLLFFEHGVTPAGMTREGLSYCGFVFRNLFPFLAGARATGAFDYRDPRQNPFVERLARVPAWYAGEVFPGGGWLQNLGDSYWDPNPAIAGFLPVFSALDGQRAAEVWRRTVGEDGLSSYGSDRSLRWSTIFESLLWGPSRAGSRLHAGRALPAAEPATPAEQPGLQDAMAEGDSSESNASEGDFSEGDFFHCEEVGYLRQWTFDRNWGFSFNSGTFIGSIHDQSDNNSFTLFAEGMPLVIDAGAANRAEEGSASSSYGHSAVLIDGRGQAPSGGGMGVSGKIEHLEREPARMIVAGDATPSYARSSYNPVRHARRWCVFRGGRAPHLLVYDDIQKDADEHLYELILHTPSPTSATVEGGRARISVELDGHSVASEILVLHPPGATIVSEPFASPGQPPFEEHTLWRVTARAINPRFVVLITAGLDAAPPHTATAEADGERMNVAVQFEGLPCERLTLPPPLAC
jgi:Heparinase II/III-like protein